MTTRAHIDELAKKLAQVASPRAKIVLFGSHARGDAKPTSDIDFLVIEPEIKDRNTEYFNLLNAVGSNHVDVVLMKQEDFDWKSMVGGTLPYWAKQEGLVLYDGQSCIY